MDSAPEPGFPGTPGPTPASPAATLSPLGAPLAHSSPNILAAKKPPKQHRAGTQQKPISLLNINCQSLCNKKAEFQNIIDDTRPDIVIATETWLKDTMKDGEIGQPDDFSEKYEIYRNDRKDGYGGVLVAVI